MSELHVQTNRFPQPDLAYRALIEAHRGLDAAESAALNARLVLILANEVGDLATLSQALQLARASLNRAAATAGDGADKDAGAACTP